MEIVSSAAAKQPVLIYSHRGAAGLAPENTIPAYYAALKVGVDYVDMDVLVTKDGVVVVTHDFALNTNIPHDVSDRRFDNKILIKDLTWKELQVLKTPIPRLQDVIKLVKLIAGNKVKFQVEIKTDPIYPEKSFSPEYVAGLVVAVLQEEKVEKYTELQAFDWQVLQLVQKFDKNIATSYLTSRNLTKKMFNKNPKIAGLWSGGFLVKDYDNSIPKMIAKLGGKVWSIQMQEVNQKNISLAHAHGLKVVPWTVNSKTAMIRMIDLSVDGIITDRPDILREVLAKKKYKLPPKFQA